MKIGFIGTGIMGAPMARNLAAAGHEVRAWNRTRAKAEAIEGVTVADSPAGATDGADALVTMLTDGDAVEAVAHAALREGIDWLQMSTVGIAATERLAALADERDAMFVDAPVLGTKQPAENGELVVLASGPADALERARPAFDAVGSKTVELGDAGAGTRMKLVLNSWLVTLVEGLAEAIAFAEALGVDPNRFLEILDGAPMGAPYAQLKGKAMIAREFPPSFPLSLALKDARLVSEAAEKAGVEAPVAAVVERQFARAVDAGHGDEDLAAAFLAVADDAGVT
jgi:3-hydroxyisobutyrate dehydrogenase